MVARKSLPISVVARKSLPISVVARKSLPKSLVAGKSLPISVVARKSLPKSVVARKSLPISVVARKSLPKSVVAKKPTYICCGKLARRRLGLKSHSRSSPVTGGLVLGACLQATRAARESFRTSGIHEYSRCPADSANGGG